LYAGTLLARSHYVREAKALYEEIDSTIDVPLFRQARSRLKGEILLAQNLTSSALAAFQNAAKDAPRVRGREFLGRAYEQNGSKKEALDCYVDTVSAKPLLWQINDPEPAGLWIDSLQAAVRLAGEVSDPRLPALSAQWIQAKHNN
jgi:hypothetical protein